MHHAYDNNATSYNDDHISADPDESTLRLGHDDDTSALEPPLKTCVSRDVCGMAREYLTEQSDSANRNTHIALPKEQDHDATV